MHAQWWWTLGGVSTFVKEVEFLGLRGVWAPATFGAFEKMKSIFSIGSHWSVTGRSAWRYRMRALASGARSARVSREHWTLSTERRVFTIRASGEDRLHQVFLSESTRRSGRVRCSFDRVRWTVGVGV